VKDDFKRAAPFWNVCARMLRCLDVMSCARTKKKSTTPQKLANSREKKNLEEEDKCAVLKYNIPLNFFFVFLFSPLQPLSKCSVFFCYFPLFLSLLF
jgi:hypothetical protein